MPFTLTNVAYNTKRADLPTAAAGNVNELDVVGHTANNTNNQRVRRYHKVYNCSLPCW